MTADVRRRGFAPLLLACSLSMHTNAFLRDGGSSTRHAAPPVGLHIIIAIKMETLFPLEGLGKSSRSTPYQNALPETS